MAETAVSPSRAPNIVGLRPAGRMLGLNLGRAGYGASLEGTISGNRHMTSFAVSESPHSGHTRTTSAISEPPPRTRPETRTDCPRIAHQRRVERQCVNGELSCPGGACRGARVSVNPTPGLYTRTGHMSGAPPLKSISSRLRSRELRLPVRRPSPAGGRRATKDMSGRIHTKHQRAGGLPADTLQCYMHMCM
ncbi:hypothetical protein FIBSPDRAFT_296935 [Athelia psychrophila]|uniref:Uncharacterized protein n=1 Tax=Athelia psychrophila TaxID=1759441 RepID=A0A167X9L4_9AGAM|nr:hypothetical protein FIBSPDRAFT_296935 [Fibularhizoctonia sp. CBS 109695]